MKNYFIMWVGKVLVLLQKAFKQSWKKGFEGFNTFKRLQLQLSIKIKKPLQGRQGLCKSQTL